MTTMISRVLLAITVAVTLCHMMPAPTFAAEGTNVYIDSDGLLKALLAVGIEATYGGDMMLGPNSGLTTHGLVDGLALVTISKLSECQMKLASRAAAQYLRGRDFRHLYSILLIKSSRAGSKYQPIQLSADWGALPCAPKPSGLIPTRGTEAARPSAPPPNPPSASEWRHAAYKAERFANGNGGDFKDGLVKEALIFDSGWALRPPRDVYQSIERGGADGYVVVDDPSASELPTRWEGEWIGDKDIRNNTDYDSVEVDLTLLVDKTAELSKVYLKQVNELIAPGAVANFNKKVKKEFWKGTWSARGSELYLHLVKE